MPLPRGVRRVLLFGGVFDPVHRAHVALPAAARDRLWGGEGWLVYVPAAQSPLKAQAARAPDADRAAMLRLALQGVARAAVWTDELDRGGEGPSYSIDTVRRAREVLEPETEVRLLIGADQAAQFHRWKEAREIMRLAPPTVMLRAPAESDEGLIAALRGTWKWRPEELHLWRSWIVEVPMSGASSTRARALLAGAPSPERDAELDALLDPRVREHAEQRGLYR